MKRKMKKVTSVAKERIRDRVNTGRTKELLAEYDAMEKRRMTLLKIHEDDKRAYYKARLELFGYDGLRKHQRIKLYKHDMNELTKAYLETTDLSELDSLVTAMFSARAKMLDDIDVIQ